MKRFAIFPTKVYKKTQTGDYINDGFVWFRRYETVLTPSYGMINKRIIK